MDGFLIGFSAPSLLFVHEDLSNHSPSVSIGKAWNRVGSCLNNSLQTWDRQNDQAQKSKRGAEGSVT